MAQPFAVGAIVLIFFMLTKTLVLDMKQLLSAALLGGALLGLTACQENNNTYDIPETYNFDNVSYTGQTERLDMVAEMSAYMKTANAPGGPVLDAAKLKDMYGDHTNNPFTNTNLNSSSKQLKNKTVSTMQATFDSYLDAAAVNSQATNTTASNGTAGIATTNEGSHYLVNANGIEWVQVFEKSLMGACFYYQGTAVYLGEGKMNVDNKDVVPGQGTAMEHHWDEAFGYVGIPQDFPGNTNGIRFWGKYINTHENVYPFNDRIMDAFIKGRAAISNDDLTTRDEQISALRRDWELVVVATAIYYLNNTKEVVANNQARGLHFLSEVYGFVASLKWGTGTGSITTMQVDAILSDLFGSADAMQANAWDVDVAKIDAAKAALIGYFPELDGVKDQL